MKNIAKEQLRDLRVVLPPLDVQAKIGRVGRALAKLEEHAERRIALKAEEKRGLMEELLTARRRFPEFAGVPWQRVVLADVLESVSDPVHWDDSRVFNLLSIRRRNGGVFHRESRLGAAIKTKSLFTVHAGDFLISRMQAVHGAFAVVPPEFEGYHVSSMYLAIRPKRPERIRTEFLHYAGYLREMYRNVLTSCHGVHIEKMTFDPRRFMRSSLLIPPSLEEQDRITAVFQAIDRELSLLTQQRDAYGKQTRALMHRLLSGDIPDLDPAA